LVICEKLTCHLIYSFIWFRHRRVLRTQAYITAVLYIQRTQGYRNHKEHVK